MLPKSNHDTATAIPSEHPGKNNPKKKKRWLVGTTTAGFCLLVSILYCMDSYQIRDLQRGMAATDGGLRIWTTDAIDDDDDGGGGSAFCLLIKDDNDIFSEWIAYHYHVFRMRRLIIAVDPDSQTSPLDVVRAWDPSLRAADAGRIDNGFDLLVTIWKDEDYAPDYFLRQDHAKIPSIVNKEVTLLNATYPKQNADFINRPILKTQWHKDPAYVRENQEIVRAEVHKVNNHRFRQHNFVSECYRKIREERSSSSSDGSNRGRKISWTVHIDTDEYLVPNPWIRSYLEEEDGKTDTDGRFSSSHVGRDDLRAIHPAAPTEGSLWTFFRGFQSLGRLGNACVMMPRTLFGSREDDTGGVTVAVADTSVKKNATTATTTITTTWNHRRFESLRWKYHADFAKKSRAKSMVNVREVPLSNAIFATRSAASIHRPLGGSGGCHAEPSTIFDKRHGQEPLAVYHYLGSMERYLSRQGDVRRDKKVYQRYNSTANEAAGDGIFALGDGGEPTPWWIGGWLDAFVETHGGDAAYSVLGERYATRTGKAKGKANGKGKAKGKSKGKGKGKGKGRGKHQDDSDDS